MSSTQCTISLFTIFFYLNVASSLFNNFPTELPVSPFYSISAVWNNHLYVLNGKNGFNTSTEFSTENTGLYSFDLSSLNITYIPNTNNISIQNTKNTKWIYTPHQLPREEYGVSIEWQAYTQINNLIYMLSPHTTKKYMLIYDLSIPRWTDIHSNNPIINNYVVCVTNNYTHIFSIGGYTGNINDTGYSQIYNIKHDKWRKTSNMGNINICASGCAYSHSTNNVYSFGGRTYKSIQTYDYNWYNNFNYKPQDPCTSIWSSHTNDNTDIILKYDTSHDIWSVIDKRLPEETVGLFCYDLQLTQDIYCMHGMDKYYNGDILKFDVVKETITVIDNYDANINGKYYPISGFMSSISFHSNEQYALLYVMGGIIDHGSKYYYLSQVDYKLFTTVQPITPAPTNAPTNTPTNAPTHSPTKAPTKTTMRPTTATPTKPPTMSPTNSPTAAPTKTPITDAPTNTPTNTPTQSPTVGPTINIPGLPKNYFSTTMGKFTLVLIGLCILLVIVGLVIYFKSNDVKMDIGLNYFRDTPTNDTLMYLTNDTDTFSL